jgi:hypothetical protein
MIQNTRKGLYHTIGNFLKLMLKIDPLKMLKGCIKFANFIHRNFQKLFFFAHADEVPCTFLRFWQYLYEHRCFKLYPHIFVSMDAEALYNIYNLPLHLFTTNLTTSRCEVLYASLLQFKLTPSIHKLQS